MVILLENVWDVVLFSPTESLLLQLTRCAGKHDRFALRLITSGIPGRINSALDSAVFSFVDATDHPAQSKAILAYAVERIGPSGVAVYTEVMHEGLEVYTRKLGAALLLGPVSPREWDALFDTLVPEEAAAGVGDYGAG